MISILICAGCIVIALLWRQAYIHTLQLFTNFKNPRRISNLPRLRAIWHRTQTEHLMRFLIVLASALCLTYALIVTSISMFCSR